jgi:hypothetical protein
MRHNPLWRDKPSKAAQSFLSGDFAVLYSAPLVPPSGLEMCAGAMSLLTCLSSELLSGVVEGRVA